MKPKSTEGKGIKQVGDVLKDKNGDNWVISGSWKHEKWIDFALINQRTKEVGASRQLLIK